MPRRDTPAGRLQAAEAAIRQTLKLRQDLQLRPGEAPELAVRPRTGIKRGAFQHKVKRLQYWEREAEERIVALILGDLDGT